MSIAQGINKKVTIRKQTGLGVIGAATAQVLRRETATFNLSKSTFENNEIAAHQQSTGITHGLRSVAGTINGVLSPNTYSTLFASLLRKAFTATAALTGMSITIGGVAGAWTLTRAAGDFLTGGIKIGDVVRLTAGTFATANLNNNILVTNVTALVITGKTVNGSTLTTEGPIASATLTVPGKKSIVPLTAQTQEYWAIEQWHSDISRSELFTDNVVGSVDVGLPSEGNATVAFAFAGLEAAYAASEVLTGATAATTTPVLTAVNGILLANGVQVGNVTGASLKIDCSAANMGAVIGSDNSPDVQRGRIKVSGQLTVFKQDGAFSTLFDAATEFGIVLVVTDDQTKDADFVSFSMSSVKFSGDTSDDGEKGIVQTMPFTAQLNSSGGAALANDQTIISIQDSLAA